MASISSRRTFIKNISNSTVMLSTGLPSLSFEFEDKGKWANLKAERAFSYKTSSFTKALWVHIGSSFPGGAKEVPYTLDQWAEAGFKLLILRIRMSDGRPLYQRTQHPVADMAKGWDPVGTINEEAKKRSMRVHPWCQVFRGVKSEFAIPNQNYLGINKEGENVDDFLCAAQKEVHDWSYSFYKELIENYDTAGVHLDFIRYAGHTCWCEYCRKTFKRETGIEMENMITGSDEWARWISQRVNNINHFVRRIRNETSIRNKELSAAVYASYPGCIVTVGQDWLTWAHEKWVDFLMPMNYYGEKDRFIRNAKIHLEGVNGTVPVFEGVGVNLPRKPWDNVLAPEALLKRSQLVKSMGFQGVCYFVSQHLSGEHLKLLKEL